MKLPEPFSSLGAVAEELAELHPNDPALRAAGRTWSRGKTGSRARVLAAGWREAGFASGDVVAVVGEGGPVFALALLSAARAGLIPLLIDPRLSSEEAREIFQRARPKAIALCGAPAAPYGAGLPVFSFDAEGCGALLGHGPAPALIHDPGAPAVLLVTSGTSGHPRVVALTASNLSSNIRSASEAHFCERGEVFLSLLPAAHAFELTTGLLGPLLCGASIVYPGSRNPNRLLRLALSEGVTRVNVVPALLAMMADEIRDAAAAGEEILDRLRDQIHAIVCGGAATAHALVERVIHRGLPLWLGYGLTEASPVVALGRADALPPGSTGRPLPGVQVHINEGTGEVLIRGPSVMAGYVGDPEASAATIKDGWLHTGDIGRIDAEGNLFILGRLKEIIVTASGEKISPEGIEAAYATGRFAEVCAVGLPDPEGGGGERAHLVVVPATEVAAEERVLREEFLRLSQAAGARRAFGMTLVTGPLPRTRSLKIRRDLVRRDILERMRMKA